MIGLDDKLRRNPTEFAIIESSPKAKGFVKSTVDNVGISDPRKGSIYPYELMYIGESFCLPLVGTSSATIRNVASRKGILMGKRFAVFKHDDEIAKCYEIARIG